MDADPYEWQSACDDRNRPVLNRPTRRHHIRIAVPASRGVVTRSIQRPLLPLLTTAPALKANR